MTCLHAKCRLALSLPCSSPEEHARLAQEAGDLYRAGKFQEAARRLGYAGIECVTHCRPDPDGPKMLVAGQNAGAYALATPLPMGWISPAQAWGDGARDALFQRGGYSPAAEEARARAVSEIEEIEARGELELPEGEIDFFNAGWAWFQRRFNETGGFSLEVQS